jgi:23S rRNA C2498 (ribose-2'-O)-methylase RlmM
MSPNHSNDRKELLVITQLNKLKEQQRIKQIHFNTIKVDDAFVRFIQQSLDVKEKKEALDLIKEAGGDLRACLRKFIVH